MGARMKIEDLPVGLQPPMLPEEALCRVGVDQGWLCRHQAGAIRYGRVIRPGAEAGGFSVDVVLMDDCRGLYHSKPGGEIDMVMPASW